MKKILVFWLPLVATWLMMAIEGPFLAAIIARMADTTFNLAAYGVAYSLALLCEAPVIMLMSASTTLVKNRTSYLRMRNFSLALMLLVSLILGFVLVPPVYDFLALSVIGLPAEVADLTYISLIFLLPWPAAIGYRRFVQGIMIAFRRPRLVTYGTVIRLVAMAGTATLLYLQSDLPGSYVGALALSAGVVSESLAGRVMARRIIRRICAGGDAGEETFSYGRIFQFYYPLALATMIGLGAHPLITVFVGQSRMAVESLAVLPVINALVFIFRAIGLSFHEVAITFMGARGEGHHLLKRFTTILAISMSIVMGLIVFTPLSDFWFITVSGLTEDLAHIATLPAQVLVLIPALSMLISYQRAIQVVSRNTKHVSFATATEVGTIIIVVSICVHLLGMVGAIAAATALLLGRLFANLYLIRPNFHALDEMLRKGQTA